MTDDGAAAYPVPDTLIAKLLIGIVRRRLVDVVDLEKPLFSKSTNARILAASCREQILDLVLAEQWIPLSTCLQRL